MSKALELRKNIEVATDKDGNVNLTDLWKAEGSPAGKEVWRWVETDTASTFIEATCQILNLGKNEVIKTRRGKGGGTYAHKQIALAYAKYISPELHLAVNQVFFERIEEEKNPALAVERGVKSWKKQGKSSEYISARLKSIDTRNKFTSILSRHGVTNNGFKDCTNAIYTPLFGGGAETVRAKKNLPAGKNTREAMTAVELAAVSLAELLASENIDAKKLEGNKACEYECNNTARLVAKTIVDSRRSQLAPLSNAA